MNLKGSCINCAAQIPAFRVPALCDYCSRKLSKQMMAALGTPAGALLPNPLFQIFDEPFATLNEEPELVAEPIIGWRVWRVQVEDPITLDRTTMQWMSRRWQKGEDPFTPLVTPFLVGVGYREAWTPGEDMAAACLNPAHAHEAPARGCLCGVWAFKHPQRMLAKLSDFIGHSASAPVAFGEVELWGRIHEHTWGWRAQYARPLRLSLCYMNDDEASLMARAYECDVIAAEPPAEAQRIRLVRAARRRLQADPNVHTGRVSTSVYRSYLKMQERGVGHAVAALGKTGGAGGAGGSGVVSVAGGFSALGGTGMMLAHGSSLKQAIEEAKKQLENARLQQVGQPSLLLAFDFSSKSLVEEWDRRERRSRRRDRITGAVLLAALVTNAFFAIYARNPLNMIAFFLVLIFTVLTLRTLSYRRRARDLEGEGPG
jgi:hypothetical protein